MAGHDEAAAVSAAHLCLSLAVFLTIGKLRADRAV